MELTLLASELAAHVKCIIESRCVVISPSRLAILLLRIIITLPILHVIREMPRDVKRERLRFPRLYGLRDRKSTRLGNIGNDAFLPFQGTGRLEGVPKRVVRVEPGNPFPRGRNRYAGIRGNECTRSETGMVLWPHRVAEKNAMHVPIIHAIVNEPALRLEPVDELH